MFNVEPTQKVLHTLCDVTSIQKAVNRLNTSATLRSFWYLTRYNAGFGFTRSCLSGDGFILGSYKAN